MRTQVNRFGQVFFSPSIFWNEIKKGIKYLQYKLNYHLFFVCQIKFQGLSFQLFGARIYWSKHIQAFSHRNKSYSIFVLNLFFYECWCKIKEMLEFKRLLALVVRSLLDVRQQHLRRLWLLRLIFRFRHREVPKVLISQNVASSKLSPIWTRNQLVPWMDGYFFSGFLIKIQL